MLVGPSGDGTDGAGDDGIADGVSENPYDHGAPPIVEEPKSEPELSDEV